MTLRTLISATDLHDLAAKGGVLIVDCRADLADRQRAARDYAQAHIPGAVFADLETDLSDLSKTGLGRHPLPDAARFGALLGRWGWTPGTPVVAYDDANGALAAARLWWMLRLIGEREVAVLDGGFGAWKGAGLPLESGVVALRPTHVDIAYDPQRIVYTDELLKLLQNPQCMLVDARAAPRFRGEVEPIDVVAGHIPGAQNRPFSDNLEADGRYKPAEKLRVEFMALLGAHAPADVINMCGSGVTACHNLLAMEHAGLAGSRIYAPSWSGYIADRSRPIGPATCAASPRAP
jgi:thiosulfate/3-mercaptopyruvate sulfurtransferase